MQLAAVCNTVPFQGLEPLARQIEMAVRSFLGQEAEGGLGCAKRRIVTLRSRLARSKKLFEAGLLPEDDYFDEVRTAEQELLGVLHEIGASVGGTQSGLAQQIAALLSEARAARSNVVFISYRRDDSAYIADRVDQHLRTRLGTSAIFRDTQSIELGDEFARRIDDVLTRTRVCLVIIGQRWRGQLSDGKSRIDQVDDWVRREVRSALDRRITVIPVLTEGVRFEELRELPDDISGIRTRHAIMLRPDPDFMVDIERLTSFVVRRLV